MQSHLNQIIAYQDKFEIVWSDGVRSFFHFLWLRDNCRCSECGEPVIGRRCLRLTDIDLHLLPQEHQVTLNGSLKVVWPDGHQSSFSNDWLKNHRYDDEARQRRGFKPLLWTKAIRENPPALDFDSISSSDRSFFELLETVRDLGLCFVCNAPATPGILEKLAVRIGPPQESNFGRVQDLVVDASKRSVAQDVVGLKPHTDEPYRASPPGLLMFHCVETDTTGAGASLFLDGFEAAEILRTEDSEGFSALSQHPQSFRRYFEGEVDVSAEFPVISTDEFGELQGVRINDRVAAPLCIPTSKVAIYYRGLKRLLQLVEDEERMMQRVLRPGDIAIFDNHRILHGRTTLTLKGRRWLQWIQVERGDFYSALRLTADRLGVERDQYTLLRGAYA